jgi:hypothetical protein
MAVSAGTGSMARTVNKASEAQNFILRAERILVNGVRLFVFIHING